MQFGRESSSDCGASVLQRIGVQSVAVDAAVQSQLIHAHMTDSMPEGVNAARVARQSRQPCPLCVGTQRNLRSRPYHVLIA